MENLANILSEARKAQNLTISDVCEITKIRRHIIESFEDGNFSELPSVYAKSFLKSYMDLLALNEADYSDQIEEIFGKSKPIQTNITKPQSENKDKERNKYKKSPLSKKEPVSERKSKVLTVIVYSVLLAAVVIMFYFTLFHEESVEYTAPDPTEQLEMQDAPDTAVIGAEEDELLSFFQESDSLILEAWAVDTAWLKIVMDGKTTEIVSMAPKQYKRWSCLENFTITLGNAGAVEFKRNGKPIDKLGPLGQVARNVKITWTEVINPRYSGDSTRRYKKHSRKKKTQKTPIILAPAPIENKKIIDRQKNQPNTDAE